MSRTRASRQGGLTRRPYARTRTKQHRLTGLQSRRPIVKVQEPCTHDVQLNGLCAICGKDLTACVRFALENFDPNRCSDPSPRGKNRTDYTGFSDTSRATISMVHDVGGLTVSLEVRPRIQTHCRQRK